MKHTEHLTVTDKQLQRRIVYSQPGQAHFAFTGPDNTFCQNCAAWVDHPDLRNRKACAQYKALTGKWHSQGLNGGTPSCKYYEPLQTS